MELGGSGRNLKTDIGAKLDASGEASFEIEVTLQREFAFVGETALNSAANIASSKGVIGPAMLFALANAMWQIYLVPYIVKSDIDGIVQFAPRLVWFTYYRYLL